MDEGAAKIAMVIRSRVGNSGGGHGHLSTIACIAAGRHVTEGRQDLASANARGLYERVPSNAPSDLTDACAALARLDPALDRVATGLAPLRWRTCPPGVAGLAWMIVGQQVSTASARSVWSKLERAVGPVDAASLLALTDEGYRACGFSRPKVAYVRALAEASPDFDSLGSLEDEAAVEALMRLKGVGRWTAETFLMMGEGRADLFPAADIALQEAVRWLDGLPARPDAAATAAIARRWAPLRSAAAHVLWAWYVAVKAGEAPHPLKPLPEAA